MLMAARIAFLLGGAILVLLENILGRRGWTRARPAHLALGAWAALNIGFVIFLFVNHATFPANLDLMEGTVLQHIRQAAALDPIYPAPTPEYVPLAYNPLFYVITAPVTWALGPGLLTARLVAMVGCLIAVWVMWRVTRDQTGSHWWGLMTVGLFAAAYRIMDAYLDTAHSDSWLIGSTLLGCWVLDRYRSRAGVVGGMLLLVAAFWFKQHGAWFVIGALGYLTWRNGWRGAWPAWLVAMVGGPLTYLVLGPTLFGPWFHHFTWEVPRQWSQLDVGAFRRFLTFIITAYPLLAGAALYALVRGGAGIPRLDIWRAMYPFVLLTGFMGTLDAGSSNNVYIPLTTWTILLGVLGLSTLAGENGPVRRYGLYLMILFISFAQLLYLPTRVVTSSAARATYADFLSFLDELDGPVYAPSLGQLPDGDTFHPAAHWVALEDMIRGPGRDTRNHPNTRQLLAPALNPAGPAYVLANIPLDKYPWIAFLEETYTLEEDLGDRFEPLRVLPGRWDHRWPRYLYRYIGPPSAPPGS